MCGFQQTQVEFECAVTASVLKMWEKTWVLLYNPSDKSSVAKSDGGILHTVIQSSIH